MTYLYVPTVYSMVQCCATGAVRHINATKQGDDGLSTLGGSVGSCNVERCLPILVTSIDICRVL